MWKLTIVDDEGTKTVLPLSRGEYTIGRDAENTIRLTERNISRKHMVLRKDGTGWIVEDLSSYNGCFVNGLRVSGNHPLHDGDLLQVGDYRIELLNESAASDGDEAAQEGAEPAPAAAAPVSRLAALPDRLVVVDGPTAGSEHPLDKEKIIIGRAEDADISVNHNSVSRIHAEITTITAGTYEIVDCGSSNGVRVNGIKLDRRVIEDDDEIELGDVRMRFVRRGRFFRPGAVPRSANSFAPSASTSPSVPAPRKGLGAMMLVGALLGIATVGGLWFLRPGQQTAQGPVVEDSAAIVQAKELANAGDLEGAHNKLIAEIPEGSPLADNPEVKRIEGMWADSVMQKAAQEPDTTKRRAMLAQVAGGRLVDSERRKKAADEINKLDSGGTDPNALPVASGSAAPTGQAPPTSTTGAGTQTPKTPDNPYDTKTPPDKTGKTPPDKTAATPPATTSTGSDPGKTVLEDGETKARRMLEPRVWSGRATVDEVRMLKAICRHQKDAACVARANQILSEMLKNQ